VRFVNYAAFVDDQRKLGDQGTLYRRAEVDRIDVFYREAGPPDAPVLLLLHGFPTSSRMFRDLIPRCRTPTG
jgi:hypothetical protein